MLLRRCLPVRGSFRAPARILLALPVVPTGETAQETREKRGAGTVLVCSCIGCSPGIASIPPRKPGNLQAVRLLIIPGFFGGAKRDLSPQRVNGIFRRADMKFMGGNRRALDSGQKDSTFFQGCLPHCVYRCSVTRFMFHYPFGSKRII